MTKKTTPRSYSLLDETHSQLSYLSERTGMSISALVRLLVAPHAAEAYTHAKLHPGLDSFQVLSRMNPRPQSATGALLDQQLGLTKSAPFKADPPVVYDNSAPILVNSDAHFEKMRRDNSAELLVKHANETGQKIDDFGIRKIRGLVDGDWLISLADLCAVIDRPVPDDHELNHYAFDLNGTDSLGVRYVNWKIGVFLWRRSENNLAKFRLAPFLQFIWANEIDITEELVPLAAEFGGLS